MHMDGSPFPTGLECPELPKLISRMILRVENHSASGAVTAAKGAFSNGLQETKREGQLVREH